MGKRKLFSNEFKGIALAITAVIVWSGNFIVARGVIKHIPPVRLAFFRWATAMVILTPIAYKSFMADRQAVLTNARYFFLPAFLGVTLYNTFLYVAGHTIPAINLALIATTSSPVFAIILAAIILKEKISWLRIAGLVLCIAGIVLLISKGSWQNLARFHFSTGDVWAIVGAFTFAAYNVLVRKKPAGISPLTFLFVVFGLGTIMLVPAFVYERIVSPPISWNLNLALVILYLGAGACVISYLCWNLAIARLGAARTALFGNLIPLFSTAEAILILHERFLTIHLFSGLLVIAGLIIANYRRK
ncbi:DMT family transporter [Foetidibacter luteolus]|uniref:DMT family transporter n=1 Tax=Foetidibacter luteolus TaxID=2608880 RepID=UPI00129C0C04|nr:DMT family transporter [Foetidibacter luteolus]